MEVSGYLQIGKAHADEDALPSLTRRRVGLRCRIIRLHEFDDSRSSVIAPADCSAWPRTPCYHYGQIRYCSYGRDDCTGQGIEICREISLLTSAAASAE